MDHRRPGALVGLKAANRKGWTLAGQRARACARPLIVLLTALVTAIPAVNANPTGGDVVAGQAVINAGGNHLTVHQSSDKAIINWQGFSIAAGEITRFDQPGPGAAALNRVLGGNPSALHGALQANGQVFLINPNGIVVGPGGRIDTQSFIASTLSVSDADFMDGGSLRFQGDSDASVVNLGEIRAAGGDVYLIAREVSNEGAIDAGGRAGLAGGGDMELRFEGNERVAIALDGGAGRVDNSGRIEAASVEIKAAGGNPFALAINNDGLVRARGATTTEDGRVILSAGRGATRHAGQIEAPGGRVDVLGDEVSVAGGIDTSSGAGGGEINVGGDYKGQGTLKLAESTEVTGDAVLRADGVGDADGGRIVVWSEATTDVAGRLSARGGESGGDGGLVETSSRGQLDFTRSVDVSAPAGAGGTWLLDPEDITIDSGKAESIETTLNDGGSVSIETADEGDGEGNINVEASITKREGDDASLSMTAHHDINVNAPIKSTHNKLDVSLTAGNAVNTNTSIETNGGAFNTKVTGIKVEPEDTGDSEDAGSSDSSDDSGSDTDPSDSSDDDASEDTASGDDGSGSGGGDDNDTGGDDAVNNDDTDSLLAEAGDSDDASDETTDGGTEDDTGSDAEQSSNDETGNDQDTVIAEASQPGITVNADVTTGGGALTLDGTGADSAVTVSAALDASSDDEQGGAVAVSGGEVTFEEGSSARADGTEGGSVTISAATESEDSGASGSVSIAEGASLSAAGTDGDGGKVAVAAENEAEVAGGIDVSSEQARGGEAAVSGDRVTLAGSASVDASGGTDGGAVRLGGGERGAAIDTAGGPLPTARQTTVDEGAVIRADAGARGDGGSVVVWADGATTFRGAISTRGGAESGAGGFAEVSGKETLRYQGTTDTGGGTLLLDPENVVVASSGGTITPGNLIADLGLNNVILDTSGSGGDAGDITVDDAVLYDSEFDLTLLAHRHVHFNASVQNEHDASGDINIVAGWDGSTAFDASAFNAMDVTGAPNAFGNNDGAVNIGDGGQASGIAVGSRMGATRVYAHDLNLTAGTGSGADGRFAQLGFQVTDGEALSDNDLGAAPAVEGGIRAHVLNDITADGGGTWKNYAQLGHVGADQSSDFTVEAAVDAAIDVAAGNDLTFTGGSRAAAYAQLGHGGWVAHGSHQGAITVARARDLTFTSGSENEAYAQLGHGGLGALGTHRGDITLARARDVTFMAGPLAYSFRYTQLGHGGIEAHGDHSGAITLEQVRDLTFTAKRSFWDYAQLGHGGAGAHGNHSGAIDVTHAGNLALHGQDLSVGYVLIGHGGGAFNSVGGDVRLRTGGNATLTDAFIGHLINSYGNYTSGDTFMGVLGALETDAASRFNSARDANGGELRIYLGDPANDNVHEDAQLNGVAHGALQAPNHQGEHAFGAGPYNVPGSDVAGEFNYYTLAALYNYEVEATEAANIVNALQGGADVDLATDLGQEQFGAFYDWDGGTQFIDINADIFYDADQALSLLATGDITLNAAIQNEHDTGGALNLVAGWDGSTDFDAAAFNAMDVTAAPDAFGHNDGAVNIGDGSQAAGIAVGSRMGAARVYAHDLNLTAGTGIGPEGRFAQLGFQVSDGVALSGNNLGVAPTVEGAIRAHVRNDITALGGDSGTFNYVQLGHVGADQSVGSPVEAAVDAAIDVAAGNDLTFTAGSSAGGSYAQFGHGGRLVRGSHKGAIIVAQARDLTFTGGSGFDEYAQLGHGGRGADGSHEGDITLAQVRDLMFTGGTPDFGFFIDGMYAQLGHGGAGADGDHSGAISLAQAQDLMFTGGSFVDAYAQLGHGGTRADGNHSGAITLAQARDLKFTGGSFVDAYAQLGHGGTRADGNHSGAIDATHAGNLALSGQDSLRRYALIGHGGDLSNGTVKDDVLLRTGGNATLTNAFVGHLIDDRTNYIGGNTFIGVGGDLATDENSRLNSAPAGNGGELRIYLTAAANDMIHEDVLLNGDPHGASPVPNLQGEYAFGNGPYAPDPAVGNFAFYLAPPPPQDTPPVPEPPNAGGGGSGGTDPGTVGDDGPNRTPPPDTTLAELEAGQRENDKSLADEPIGEACALDGTSAYLEQALAAGSGYARRPCATADE